MVCKTCGRTTLNEEANFCDYCGSTFREHMQAVITPVINDVKPSVDEGVQKNQPISFLYYLGMYGVFFIPLVGPISFFVLLIYLAASKKTPENKKNWAKATLIFVIAFLFYIFYITFQMLILMSDSNFMEAITTGNFQEYFSHLYGI